MNHDWEASVSALLSAQEGHFVLESGHHGRLWLDVDGAFWRPAAVEPLAEELTHRLEKYDPEVVCGPLVGGALLGYLVARRLGATFTYTERRAHDPGRLYSARYELPESAQVQVKGQRVAVVDDVVNAGSAVRSTLAALSGSGGEPVAVAALLRLGNTALDPIDASGGAGPIAEADSTIASVPLHTLTVQANELWEPRSCPMCAQEWPVQRTPLLDAT